MELQQILKNLIDHFDHLLHDDDKGRDLLNEEFWALKDAGGDTVADTTNYPRLTGGLAKNRSKNRYRDILPFDYSRVKLQPLPDVEHSDYINANFVKGIKANHEYIASQAPTPHTLNDFWRMIWEWDVKVILMACNEYEGGNSTKMKCAKYWPTDEEPNIQFGEISISLKSLDERDNGDFLVRRFQVDSEGKSRTVMHYHYTAWPDHGIPHSMVPIIDMLASARLYQPQDKPPIVIHCSAGCGRTGTLIAIDYVWSLLKADMISEQLNVLEILIDMRKQRQSLVQTRDQYEVVYRAIIELFKRQIYTDDEHLYGNADIRQTKARSQQSIKHSASIASDILASLGEEEQSTEVTYGNQDSDCTVVQQPNNKTRIIINEETASAKPKRTGRPPNQRHTYENAAPRPNSKSEQPSRHSDGNSGVSATIRVDDGISDPQPMNAVESYARPSAAPPKPPIKPSRHSSHEKSFVNRGGSVKTNEKPPLQTKPAVHNKNGSIKKSISLDIRPLSGDTKPKTPNKPPISAKPPTPVKPNIGFNYDMAGDSSSSATTSSSSLSRRTQSVKNPASLSLTTKQSAIDIPTYQKDHHRAASVDNGSQKPGPYENTELKQTQNTAVRDSLATYHLAAEAYGPPGDNVTASPQQSVSSNTPSYEPNNTGSEYAYADTRLQELAKRGQPNSQMPQQSLGEGYDIAEDESDDEGHLPPPPVPDKTVYSLQEYDDDAHQPPALHDNHYDDVEINSKSDPQISRGQNGNGVGLTLPGNSSPGPRKPKFPTANLTTILKIPGIKSARRPSNTSVSSVQEDIMYRGQNMSYPNKPQRLQGEKSMPLDFKR